MPDDDDQAFDPQDDDAKHQAAKPPSVTGEEDVFSGDAAGAEPADIDAELEKVGLRGDFHGDDEDVKPLGVKEDTD